MGEEAPKDSTRPEVRRKGPRPEPSALLTLVGPGDVDGAVLSVRVVELPARLTIGRAVEPGAGREGVLQLQDPLLSRVHARVTREAAGRWRVEDAGSLNGTLVSGERIDEPCALSDRTVFFLGSWAAVFHLVSPEAATALDEERANPFGPVPTLSPPLAETLWRVGRLVRARSDFLLLGETGVGKEVYAQAIHRASGRGGRFVAINCAAVPAELAESELFGYARGAHSTATEAKPGLVQAAHGGTLFLDEVGDMSPALQGKLLRFLQEREVLQLGSTVPRPVDVMVVAATSRLTDGTGHRTLRADLAARLGAEPITIPPLRERIEDLAHLVPYFLRGTPIHRLELAALRALFLYGWPRNVRELEKAMQHAAGLAPGDELRFDDLPRAVQAASESDPMEPAQPPRLRTRPSLQELDDLLRRHHGNVAQVARSLDRRGHVVWRWINEHRLEPQRYRQ